MKTKFDTYSEMKNLQMNQDTYKLRRDVMNIIYEAKKLKNIPRVSVRITEDSPDTLGAGRMKGNIIWISKRAVKNRNLRTIVYHELLHTCYGVDHQKGDILMDPRLRGGLTKEQVQKRFVYWANKAERDKK